MSASELLVEGYIRQLQLNNNRIIVPLEVANMIFSFYPKKYKIYGIGWTSYKQFGTNKHRPPPPAGPSRTRIRSATSAHARPVRSKTVGPPTIKCALLIGREPRADSNAGF